MGESLEEATFELHGVCLADRKEKFEKVLAKRVGIS